MLIKGKLYAIKYLFKGVTGLANIPAKNPTVAIEKFRNEIVPGASVETITELCDWSWEEE